MNTQTDIVIVGGGPAGTATALAIAHAAPELAARVVLLERARYPREKPCAGAVGARADVLLRAVGVEVDVPSVPIDGVSLRGAEREGVAAPGRIGRVVRRTEFDHALARAAASRGVSVRDGVCVKRVNDDGAAGVVVETSEGSLRARVVVGCDGVGSVVRRALGVGQGSFRAQVVEVDTEPVAADRDRALLHFDASDRRVHGYAWDFPTLVDGHALVCRGVYRLKFDGAVADDDVDVATLLVERLRAMGIDPTHCKQKRYSERGYEAQSPVARGALMLVGEAAGIDPATGEGIAQAIEYGVMAGRFLARRFGRGGRSVAFVEDWRTEVAASRLARDLRVRARIARLFYGAGRSDIDRFLAGTPDAMYIGCQHFAGQPYDWRRLGNVAARGAVGALAAMYRRATARAG